jgi:hypothetical protein
MVLSGLGWTFALTAVIIYCIWQAVRDFRRGERAMGLFGAVCAGVLMMLPIQSQAIKIDLPIADR